jgi:hypothetical protein
VCLSASLDRQSNSKISPAEPIAADAGLFLELAAEQGALIEVKSAALRIVEAGF